MCDVVGCEQDAEFYDNMDNELCRDCMERDMEENGKEPEDYEEFTEGTKCPRCKGAGWVQIAPNCRGNKKCPACGGRRMMNHH